MTVHSAGCRGDRAPLAERCPTCVVLAREVILATAARAGWPRVQAGRLLVGPGEIRWRQGVQLAPLDALPDVARALEDRRRDPSRLTGPSGALTGADAPHGRSRG